MIPPSSLKLEKKLHSRFGLEFFGCMEEIDGGNFFVLRPKDLPKPNGFGIILARTPRWVEASFRLDSFTRSLLQQMSEADEIAKANFYTLFNDAITDGFRISVSINGTPLDPLIAVFPEEKWEKLDIECDKKLEKVNPSSDEIQHAFIDVTSKCLGIILPLISITEESDFMGFELGLPEGAKTKIEVNKYERSSANRIACIAHYGTKCQVCSFDFQIFYGDIGEDFIEVHHETPISEMGSSYRINPIKDLIPVCANCHAMLHRKTPPYSVKDLKKMISQRKQM